MPRPLWYLLALVPLAIFGAQLGLPSAPLFFVSLGAIVPLAALIGLATDQIALVKGPKVGGILNATFGNVPDLLVGYFGVRAGLIPFVKATLVGAIISNTGLVIGLSFFVAGIGYGYVRFDPREAGHHTVLMILAVAGLLLPSIVGATVHPTPPLEGLSIGVSIILLVAYLAYVAFSIFGLTGTDSKPAEAWLAGEAVSEEAVALEPEQPRLSLGYAVLLLIGATATLAPVSDALVASVTPTIRTLGWSDVFAGMIFVSNAGNAAEMYTAIAMARKNRLDLSLNVASGSSIQIATLVAPVILLISLLSNPMNLAFTPLQVSILGVVVAVFAYVAHDGETNWLEGFQLIAIYTMAAVVFFLLP